MSTAVNDQPDIIAPIGTKLSQEAVKNAPHAAIIFLGVTAPLDAGVVKSLSTPELSTGVSDLVPLAKLLVLIRQVTPFVKKIGVPYTDDDPPAIFSVRQLQELGPGGGFVIDARPVNSQDDMDSIVRELARVNDAIVVGADTGLFPAADRIAKIARQARKPFYAGDPDGVKAGAALGVTIDYRDVGRAGATLAARMLKGEKPGVIPVTLLTEGVVMVNQTSLDQLHIRLNDDVRKQVKQRKHLQVNYEASMPLDQISFINDTLFAGILYGLVCLSFVLTAKYLRFPDLTCGGSFVLGGAISALCIVKGGLIQ